MVRTPQFDLLVAFLVLASIAAFAIETLPHRSAAPLLDSIDDFENAVALFFAAEYLLRWWGRSLRPSYLLKPSMVIDLVSFLPTLIAIALPDIAASASLGVRSASDGSLTFLRVLRILRLNRFVRDAQSFANLRRALGSDGAAGAGVGADGGAVRAPLFELALARVVTTISSLIVVTSGCLYETEPQQIPDFFTACFCAC